MLNNNILNNETWTIGVNQLIEKDPVLAKIISKFPHEKFSPNPDSFLTLAQSIVGQQISVKAAATIWQRLQKLCKDNIAINSLSKVSEQELKQIGLSRQKIAYLQELCLFNPSKIHWSKLSNDEVVNEVTAIKGIGLWTAEMFLIFHLGRRNILPKTDIGLLKAIELNYQLSVRQDPELIKGISEKWRPWQTIATWYLWKSIDPIAVAY